MPTSVVNKYCKLLNDPNPERRIRAVIRLNGLKDQRGISSAVKPLCGCLKDEDERVRFHSIGALRQIYPKVSTKLKHQIIQSVAPLLTDRSDRVNKRAWDLILYHKYGY